MGPALGHRTGHSQYCGPMLGENPTYDSLVQSLADYLAGNEDLRVIDREWSKPPYAIGSHRPDVTAWAEGRFMIGVAATSHQLSDPATVERLRAFLAWRDRDGVRAVIHLCVPEGWDGRARQAFLKAGGGEDDELNNVRTLSGLGVAPPD
jgi:hypothetical protein